MADKIRRRPMSSPTVIRAIRSSFPVAVALFLLSSAFRQSTGGRVIGKLSDSTGAVISGVKVPLINQGTGVSRDTTTNENGDYTFVEVAPANYRVEYTLQGFKKYVRPNVTLEINQVLTLNAALDPGGAQEV